MYYDYISDGGCLAAQRFNIERSNIYVLLVCKNVYEILPQAYILILKQRR